MNTARKGALYRIYVPDWSAGFCGHKQYLVLWNEDAACKSIVLCLVRTFTELICRSLLSGDKAASFADCFYRANEELELINYDTSEVEAVYDIYAGGWVEGKLDMDIYQIRRYKFDTVQSEWIEYPLEAVKEFMEKWVIDEADVIRD